MQTRIARAPAVSAENVLVDDSVTANGIQQLANAPPIQTGKRPSIICLAVVQRLKSVARADLARCDLERPPQVLLRAIIPAEVMLRLALRAGHRECDGFYARRLMRESQRHLGK